MKVAVVYWSGTGNTKAMAMALAKGAESVGAEVDIMTSDEFLDVDGYDAVAFGCSANGSEELEESSFEPMFASIEDKLGDKKIALFGSYGWGGGQWMRDWEERIDGKCSSVIGTVVCSDAPDEDTLEELEELGKKLAE